MILLGAQLSTTAVAIFEITSNIWKRSRTSNLQPSAPQPRFDWHVQVVRSPLSWWSLDDDGLSLPFPLEETRNAVSFGFLSENRRVFPRGANWVHCLGFALPSLRHFLWHDKTLLEAPTHLFFWPGLTHLRCHFRLTPSSWSQRGSEYLIEVVPRKARKHCDVSASAFTTLDAKQEWRVLRHVRQGCERPHVVIAENHLLEECMKSLRRNYFLSKVRPP